MATNIYVVVHDGIAEVSGPLPPGVNVVIIDTDNLCDGWCPYCGEMTIDFQTDECSKCGINWHKEYPVQGYQKAERIERCLVIWTELTSLSYTVGVDGR